MASSDLLSNICDELDVRLRELRPLVDEYESLLDAAAALELAGEEDRAAATEPPVPVAAAASAKPARRRGRPPGKRSAGRPAPEPDAEPAPAPEPAPEPAVDVKAEAESRSRPRTAKQPSTRRPDAGAPTRAQRGAAAVAILAALEHGSHTVSELAVVTALSGAIINNNLRRLQQVGAITRTKREGDGKAAYALTAAAA
jgi:pyruvate dehydrogenase E2 component (dihydrolipoamide acetyltransferase)